MNEVERQAKLFSNFLCHAHLLLYTHTNTLPHTLPHSHTQTHTHTLPPILSLTTDFFLFTVSVLYTNTHCQCILPTHVLPNKHALTLTHMLHTHILTHHRLLFTHNLCHIPRHTLTHTQCILPTHTLARNHSHTHSPFCCWEIITWKQENFDPRKKFWKKLKHGRVEKVLLPFFRSDHIWVLCEGLRRREEKSFPLVY